MRGRNIIVVDEHSLLSQELLLQFLNLNFPYRYAVLNAETRSHTCRLPECHPARFHAQRAEAYVRAGHRNRGEQCIYSLRHYDSVGHRIRFCRLSKETIEVHTT